MKNDILALALTLLTGPLFAQSGLRSQKAIQSLWVKDSIQFTLQQGFHFNAKAPQQVTWDQKTLKPIKSEPRLLLFGPSPNTAVPKAQLYVCDDADTFCEILRMDIPRSAAAPGNLPGAHNSGKTNKRVPAAESDGSFLLDDLKKAQELAKKTSRLILIDFGARWCPACLRLEDEVFRDPNFVKFAADWVFLKLDVDQFENQTLVDKYQVLGFPTLLFVNPAGDEILRLNDFAPLSQWTEIQAELHKDSHTLTELLASPKGSPAQKTLLSRLARAGQFEKWLSLAQDGAQDQSLRPIWLEAQFETQLAKAVKSKGAQPTWREVAELLQQEPKSSRSLRWRQELVGALLAEKGESQNPLIKQLCQDSQNLTEELINQPMINKDAFATDNLGEFLGFEKFYVAFLNAETAASAEIGTKGAWRLAVQTAQDAKIPPTNLGLRLRYLATLQGAGRHTQSLKLVNEMLMQSPESGDLLRRKLKALVKLGRFKEAIAVGRKALSKSYGINELMVVEPLAQALMGNRQNHQALTLLQEYVKRPELNTHRLQSLSKRLLSLQDKAESHN